MVGKWSEPKSAWHLRPTPDQRAYWASTPQIIVLRCDRPACVYVLDMIATVFLIPALKGKALE
jgi:hypothetical protein